MHGDLDWNGFITDNSVLQMKRLYQDEDFGFKLKKNGDIINHRLKRIV
jgi:hypothetical protein